MSIRIYETVYAGVYGDVYTAAAFVGEPDVYGTVYNGSGGVYGLAYTPAVVPEPSPTPWRGGGANLFTPAKRRLVRRDPLEDWLAVGFSLEIAIALSEDDDHA